MKKTVIFSPGPANISERVRRALTLPDICHRDSEFSQILLNTREMILKVCATGSTYQSVIFGGSGTLSIEAVISAFSGCPKKILIISNGVYGERAAAIAGLHGVAVKELKSPWGKLPDLNLVEDELKNEAFIAVYLVHHETTTGLLNPLKAVCAIAKKYKKLVLADTVSSLAGEALDIGGWGVDAAVCSANKCIRGVPGVSFAVLSRRFLQTVEKLKKDSLYADLLLHLESENRGQTPFTPAVQVFYAFREALKELLEEGVDNRISDYRQTSDMLRQGLKKLGLKFYIPEVTMSNTMTVVYTPRQAGYVKLHDEFKKKGFVIYASQGKLKDSTFRLGTVGLISHSDINRFLEVFKVLL